MVLISCGFYGFVYLRTLTSCLIVFFLFLLLYGFMLPRGSAPEEGGNVMAWLHMMCPGPGNTRFLLSARHEPWISSDNLTLILLYNVDIHICNHTYWYSFLQGQPRAYAFTATWSSTAQDSLGVECASWLLLIPFWLEANYIFLMTSHFCSLSSFSQSPHQQIMAQGKPHKRDGGSDSSWTTGTSSNVPLYLTQQ